MKTVRAKISWLKLKNTSGQPVMSKTPYRPIIVFNGQYDKPIWEGNTATVPLWSCQIFHESINKKESISTVSYMVDKAPSELMQIGAEFELYEGVNKVAIGKIIE